MPAKLTVISGPDKGNEIWIEDEVVRIGRGDNCAVPLSDARLPAHVATLEFRDGHYNLYSRMEDEIILNGRALAPRGFDRWLPGKDLQLPGANVLRLETERDPRPSRRPRQTAQPEPEPEADEVVPDEEGTETAEPTSVETAAASKKRSQQMTMILIILLCAIGGVFVLLMEEDPDSGPVTSPTQEFSALVTTFYEKKADDTRYQDLREALQIARTAELRKDTKTALRNYGRLRDTLVARLKSSGEVLEKDDRDLLDRTLKFVTIRLRTATDESAE